MIFILPGSGFLQKEQEVYRVGDAPEQAGSKFSENLIDATQAWTLHFEDSSGLAGLPEAELKLLEGIAKTRDQGGWVVDLSAPSFHAVMTHANDSELRREVYTAYVTRASDQGPTSVSGTIGR